jgi:hypothetical protein
MPKELNAIVPTATREILEKNAARGLAGFLMHPRSAVGGSLTWLKYVSEWFRGREPPRGGKTLRQNSGQSLRTLYMRIVVHLIATPDVMEFPSCN